MMMMLNAENHKSLKVRSEVSFQERIEREKVGSITLLSHETKLTSLFSNQISSISD
jgi:hypothetical protein